MQLEQDWFAGVYYLFRVGKVCKQKAKPPSSALSFTSTSWHQINQLRSQMAFLKSPTKTHMHVHICKKPRWQSTLAHYIKVAKVSLILSAVESVPPQLEECKYKAWHDDLRHTLLLYLSSVWPFSGLWPTNELEAHGSGRPNFWGLCGSKHLVCHLGRVLMSSHEFSWHSKVSGSV